MIEEKLICTFVVESSRHICAVAKQASVIRFLSLLTLNHTLWRKLESSDRCRCVAKQLVVGESIDLRRKEFCQQVLSLNQ